jgi:asparagine synthase (glutamine-hydrolysing)
MEGHLPNDILYRQKMGFVTPISAWFRGALAGQARDVIENSRLSESGWFDTAQLSKMAADHRAGVADHGRLLWQLVMLDKSLGRVFG